MEDNPYRVPDLLPDEFDELLGSYENFVEWCQKDMTPEQRELSDRVLKKLRQADEDHVCVDELQEGGSTMPDWIKPFQITSVYRSDLLRVSLTQEQAESFTDEDMLKIANIMAVKYLEGGFYTHLLAAVEQVLQEKEREHGTLDRGA